MSRRVAGAVVVLLASALGAPTAPRLPPMRGICWEASGPIEAAALAPIAALGSDWISQTPFGWCPSQDSPELHFAGSGRMLWGESDAGLAATARFARERGIRTLLKPHLWVRHGWPGAIEMASETDWARFFAAYEEFILHHARLAERERMEGLAVGTELCRTTARGADWRRLIARVREVYHGQITYCANWHEAEGVPFWDAVDFIGVQAYYPLAADRERPELTELRAAWQPVVTRLALLSHQTGKRVVFTEVGYRSVAGSAREPWSWDVGGVRDLELQRDAYQAMFESVWAQPWFGGAFVWKWRPRLSATDLPSAPQDRDFTPQGKPALGVIRAFYTRN